MLMLNRDMIVVDECSLALLAGGWCDGLSDAPRSLWVRKRWEGKVGAQRRNDGVLDGAFVQTDFLTLSLSAFGGWRIQVDVICN